MHVSSQTFGGEGKLVQRGHGRIYRTEAGDLFLRYCESMLSVATEACKALQDYRSASRSVDDLAAAHASLKWQCLVANATCKLRIHLLPTFSSSSHTSPLT